MDYKSAYAELLNAVMDDSDNVSLGTLQKVQSINNNLSEDQTNAGDESGFISSAEWNGMSYYDRVELKHNNPEAYQNSLHGKFEEGD